MGIQIIDVSDLRLDTENPRHDPVTDQGKIVNALLAKVGRKMVALASDIADHGPSPMDVLLVLPEPDGRFTVLEGNRRLAIIKLLNDPSLADSLSYRTAFATLKSKLAAPINEMPCSLVASRDEARHWLTIRHSGEDEGRGVVRWDTAAIARFFKKSGTQSSKAVLLADALRAAYPANTKLQTDLDVVMNRRATTIGRLVNDPAARDRIGIVLDKEGIAFRYPSEELEPLFSRILSDFAGEKNVTHVDNKTQRAEYVNGLGFDLPDEMARLPIAVPLEPPKGLGAETSRPVTKATIHAVPKRLFEGVQLTNFDPRIRNILAELQRLDVNSYPNACAALVRIIIELAVTEAHINNGWRTGSLRAMVKKCVYEIDRGQTDLRFEPVRVGLNDGTSMFAVDTIHGWLHNANYHPVGSELRAVSSNYTPFLTALDGLTKPKSIP